MGQSRSSNQPSKRRERERERKRYYEEKLEVRSISQEVPEKE